MSEGRKMLYDYCACCGRRIEIGNGEMVMNTMYDGEPQTFCSKCVKVVDVDKESGIIWAEYKPMDGKG